MIARIDRPFQKHERRLLRIRARQVRRALDAGHYSSHVAPDYERYYSRLNAELAGERAFVIRCEPLRIISRDEEEDEGAAWVFDGGDGSYLAMFGQDFRPTARFPSRSFDLVFGATLSTYLGVQSRALATPSSNYIRCADSYWLAPYQDWFLFHAPTGIPAHEAVQRYIASDIEHHEKFQTHTKA